jgi:hypothetical protein
MSNDDIGSRDEKPRHEAWRFGSGMGLWRGKPLTIHDL